MLDTSKSSKIPKYVKVYDALFSQIRNETLPQGSCLPTEPELARQMGVSRATLRQALALLEDDHLIQIIRGKGNYVLNYRSSRRVGLETLAHPLQHCCKEPISETELELRIDIPSDYYIQNLGRQTHAVVVCNRWYTNQGQVVAYSFSFLPIEVTTQAGLDLSSTEQVEEFLDKRLYEEASYSSLAVSQTGTGRFMSTKHQLPTNSTYVMLYEVIYGPDDAVLAVSKHYVATENCEVLIYTRPASGKLERAEKARR